MAVTQPASSPVDDVLSFIRERYIAARERCSRSARYTQQNCPPHRCRYCGRKETFFAQGLRSHLDGHLRCMVDPLFVDELRAAIMHRADITYAVLGDALQLNANCARLLVWRGARDNGRQEHR